MRRAAKAPRYSLSESPLFNVRGRSELCRILNIAEEDLEALRNSSDRYRERDEETKPGKIRHIENPPNDLKRVQTRISTLLMRIFPPEYLFCPVVKRGHVESGREHYGAAQIWSLDIKDYFPSTPREFVFRFFRHELCCVGDVAGILADLTCFNGHLPTGAPSSPILAYMAYRRAWDEVQAATASVDGRMTLWIDDLTVSGNRISTALRWKIKSALRAVGLRYHKEKFTHGGVLKITGTAVSRSKFCLPHDFYKSLREVKRQIREAKTVEDRAALRRTLAGKLEYMRYFLRQKSLLDMA